MAGQRQIEVSLTRSLVCVLVLIGLILDQADGDAVSWNYKTGNDGGPEKWHIKYPDCGGVMQSPININTTRALYDPDLQYFDFTDYQKTDGVTMQLENVDGHTAEVIFTGGEIYLRGGSLPDIYRLQQFHFHWGQNNTRGSEHSLNGVHYPMEVHFVHTQKNLSNVSIAAPHPNGLAVVSFFFTVGKKNNKYEQLLTYFDNITLADQKIEIYPFPIIQLLPPSAKYNYYRYQGSLTTPPCYESVIWSVATDVIEISTDQINKFRSLFDEEKKQLVDDFRPLQSLNKRTVLTTFPLRQDGNLGDNGSLILPQTISIVISFILMLVLVF